MTRTARLLATLSLAALALTGCGNGIGPSGAAATVGDERISTSRLEALVDRSLADPGAQQTLGADKPAFTRTALRRLISHALVTDAAAREHVELSGGDVDATFAKFSKQVGGDQALEAAALKQGIAKDDLRREIADITLRDLISDKLTAAVVVPEASLQQAYQENIATYDQVRSAHILVPTQAKAVQLLAAVKADPSRFAALAAQNSTDTASKDKGGDLGFQGRGALEKNFENAIFSNPPGSFVIAKTQFGFHVIDVIARETTTFEQARTDLRRNLLGAQRQAAITQLLLTTAKDEGVRVNPRFGTWDNTKQEVVAPVFCADTAVSSPSPRPGDAAAEQPTPEPVATDACP